MEQLELRAAEAEREGSRLREASVDSQSLLDTMSRDKEALSRSVGQNRELKTQLVELQDAFVKMSKQNMELATELETERFKVTQLQSQLQSQRQRREEAEARTEVATQTEEDEEDGEDVGGRWTVGGNEDGGDRELMEVLPDSSHLNELLQVRVNLHAITINYSFFIPHRQWRKRRPCYTISYRSASHNTLFRILCLVQFYI